MLFFHGNFSRTISVDSRSWMMQRFVRKWISEPAGHQIVRRTAIQAIIQGLKPICGSRAAECSSFMFEPAGSARCACLRSGGAQKQPDGTEGGARRGSPLRVAANAAGVLSIGDRGTRARPAASVPRRAAAAARRRVCSPRALGRVGRCPLGVLGRSGRAALACS